MDRLQLTATECVNATPQMTCFRGAKSVHKMATRKVMNWDSLIISLDTKWKIQKSGKSRIVHGLVTNHDVDVTDNINVCVALHDAYTIDHFHWHPHERSALSRSQCHSSKVVVFSCHLQRHVHVAFFLDLILFLDYLHFLTSVIFFPPDPEVLGKIAHSGQREYGTLLTNSPSPQTPTAITATIWHGIFTPDVRVKPLHCAHKEDGSRYVHFEAAFAMPGFTRVFGFVDVTIKGHLELSAWDLPAVSWVLPQFSRDHQNAVSLQKKFSCVLLPMCCCLCAATSLAAASSSEANKHVNCSKLLFHDVPAMSHVSWNVSYTSARWSNAATILWFCGREEEVVRGVHTLIAGVVQVYHWLHVVQEEEKGRKVEQEIEREDQGEETCTHGWPWTMTWKTQTWAEVHVCVKMKTRQHYLRNVHDAQWMWLQRMDPREHENWTRAGSHDQLPVWQTRSWD